MSDDRLTWPTRSFLILLRLVIGWHFFFEGVSKLNTYDPEPPPAEPAADSPTQPRYGWPLGHPDRPKPADRLRQPKKPWSSEAYLREATGPLAGFFHRLAGDPLLDRLEVRPADAQGAANKLDGRLPVGLEKDWDAYLDRFIQHYAIEGKQFERLETVLKQRKAKTVQFLLDGTTRVKKPAPAGNAVLETDQMIPQRVALYKEKLRQYRALQDKLGHRDFDPDAGDEVKDARDEVNKVRAELQTIVDEQNREMKAALWSVLTAEQRDEGPVPEPVTRRIMDWERLDWIDFLTRWGLTVIGACLLLGLFTRSACVGGAMFLLMFYLAMPALPWLPPNPRAEGHYFYINKNIIEMLALLALATTRSGRWVGLDSLVRFLRPSVWRTRRSPRAEAGGTEPAARPQAATPKPPRS
jgi:uncharacterized membrane protein YphA (DoxX/SURF4 family)